MTETDVQDSSVSLMPQDVAIEAAKDLAPESYTPAIELASMMGNPVKTIRDGISSLGIQGSGNMTSGPGTHGYESTNSRSGAFREAKAKAFVPATQHPDNVRYEKLTDQTGAHVEARVYEFNLEGGIKATISEHSLGHSKGQQGPHFNSELSSSTGETLPLSNGADSHSYIRQEN